MPRLLYLFHTVSLGDPSHSTGSNPSAQGSFHSLSENRQPDLCCEIAFAKGYEAGSPQTELNLWLSNLLYDF